MTQPIGVSASGQNEVFDVRKTFGIPADGDRYVVDTACARGSLLYLKSDGVASPITSAIVAASCMYLGFVEQDVIAAPSTPGLVELQMDYRAVLNKDLVAIWQFGEFYVTSVVGSVASGVPVYPGVGVNGSLSATQTISQPSVGVCIKGNSVSGGPIIVRISLLACKQ